MSCRVLILGPKKAVIHAYRGCSVSPKLPVDVRPREVRASLSPAAHAMPTPRPERPVGDAVLLNFPLRWTTDAKWPSRMPRFSVCLDTNIFTMFNQALSRGSFTLILDFNIQCHSGIPVARAEDLRPSTSRAHMMFVITQLGTYARRRGTYLCCRVKPGFLIQISIS